MLAPIPRLHAPAIHQPPLEWLNTQKPLSLADLKGKVVLLDFWTFCCINCMQILPTLRRLEDMFHKELVVIGVHTPKFSAEKDINNLRAAIARYDIRHPIIHDPEYRLWSQYDVHAWPTLVFIDPQGYIIGKTSGEPDPLHLMNAVRDLIDGYEAGGLLTPSPFPWTTPETGDSALLFPGKIKAVPGTQKNWMVADSGHHQIVLLNDEGEELQRIDTGKKACADGHAAEASFHSPQGLCADSAAIYVADTGNHALRRIDRKTHMVTTLAGNGERGHLLINKFENALNRALASPWDLEIKNTILFFANAGTHQIGGLDLEAGHVRLVAGHGAEGLRDGNPLTAEMAQPSSLLLHEDGYRLFFIDSETSSLRMLDMKGNAVHTLVGKGLFDFGLTSGPFHHALFQHPLACCALGKDTLAVADSYNNTIRLISLLECSVTELGGEEGLTCLDPVCLPFAEPAGIWADGTERLLLSDTNNHRIVDIDLTAKTMKTWGK